MIVDNVNKISGRNVKLGFARKLLENKPENMPLQKFMVQLHLEYHVLFSFPTLYREAEPGKGDDVCV